MSISFIHLSRVG